MSILNTFMFYKTIPKLRFFINDLKRLISIPFPVYIYSSLKCWFPVQFESLNKVIEKWE